MPPSHLADSSLNWRGVDRTVHMHSCLRFGWRHWPRRSGTEQRTLTHLACYPRVDMHDTSKAYLRDTGVIVKVPRVRLWMLCDSSVVSATCSAVVLNDRVEVIQATLGRTQRLLGRLLTVQPTASCRTATRGNVRGHIEPSDRKLDLRSTHKWLEACTVDTRSQRTIVLMRPRRCSRLS